MNHTDKKIVTTQGNHKGLPLQQDFYVLSKNIHA